MTIHHHLTTFAGLPVTELEDDKDPADPAAWLAAQSIKKLS